MVPLARGVGFGQMIGSILITTNTYISLILRITACDKYT